MTRILSAVLAGILAILYLPMTAVTAPTVAVVPERWQPPSDGGAIDFALGAQADAWLRHDSLGDPSFDSFEHRPGNPIVRGKPPLNWPVNGFLFEDPKSGYWYAYIGNYLTGYDIGPGLPTTHCRVHRSKDRGKTWEEIGPIFNDPKFRFEGDTQTANGAPDVTVAFADGRYHLAYDWFSDNLAWAGMLDPPKGFDNGCAYAWSERPEGPFHRAAHPILRTSDMARRFDHEQKVSPRLRHRDHPSQKGLARAGAGRLERLLCLGLDGDDGQRSGRRVVGSGDGPERRQRSVLHPHRRTVPDDGPRRLHLRPVCVGGV